MSNEVVISGSYHAPITASANILPRPGDLLGFWVASTTSGTIALYDSPATGTGTPIVAATTFPAIGWYPCPISVSTGLYAVLGATINVTFVFA